MPIMTNATQNDVKQVIDRAAKFTRLWIAMQYAFAYSANVRRRVMLGDDGRFWVVTPADASRLEKAGYEYAN